MEHYPLLQSVKIENLLKMADYIEKIPQKVFDMEIFRSGNDEKHNCDSIGCIIGHCVILDSLSNIPYDCDYHSNGEKSIDFHKWCREYTGIHFSSYSGLYLFSSEWSNIDNTPEGAAKRIRYFVKNGLPFNWSKQLEGSEPLSYNQ